MARTPSTLFADKLAEVHRVITELESGGASATATIGTVTYSVSDLEQLYKTAALYRVKAAIQAIEEGAQSYTIDGMTFAKANLPDLYTRESRLEQRATKDSRGGIRVRLGVPGA